MGVPTIRLPEYLHEGVWQVADAKGISMNQFVMLAGTEKVTRLDEGQSWAYPDALEWIGEVSWRREESLQEAAQAVLERAPNESPPPEDRLPEKTPTSAM